MPALRLGVLPYGAVQWIADVIVHHGLDRAHGFALLTSRIASTEASKIALMGGAVDVAYADWPFVAAQRLHGGHLCLAGGGSASLGGVMVPAGSRVHGLADLAGLRLGVAGGAADKSWLVVREAARRSGVDLMAQAKLSYGAPPLLEALARQGALDALLTFWTSAARLEAAGFHEAISVASCAHALGLAEPPVLLGYVFDERWGQANRAALDGFLAASRAATSLMADAPTEWMRLRPLMNAPDDALFDRLRARFVAGIANPTPADLRGQAGQLQTVLAVGGPALPPGMFWPGDAD